ncbi:MAG: hypothetical protein NC184_03575 [Roseburia sp.]|nr:hypothetical protein [Roseburia sp.]
MKARYKIVSIMVCAVMFALPLTACGRGASAGESALLGEPKAVEAIEYSALEADDYLFLKKGVEAFAADFAAYSYSVYNGQDNFAVSPISVYMALALSAECTAGNTRREILDALGVTYQQLETQFPTLYRSLAVEHKRNDKTVGLLDITNSVWIDSSADVKRSCIESLSENYYAYSYSADFKYNTEKANSDIRDFVKKQTKGLIDKDFLLSDETLFTLINTLYLKTIWRDDGSDLPFASDSYDFTAKDGSVKNVLLLQGFYNSGRTAEFDTFTTFYTTTYSGYKIKFILPKDGHTIDSVFSTENIASVNSIEDYGSYDESMSVHYMTRVLFPEYKCKYDDNITEILQDKFGIDLFFRASECDLSALTDTPSHCDTVMHVTDLTVDRKGIEGAAATAEALAGTSAPSEIIIIKEDFIVDRAFGFIITDRQDVTLFSGVVSNI